jgi:tetratricopeptide (TPR) repeat protein
MNNQQLQENLLIQRLLKKRGDCSNIPLAATLIQKRYPKDHEAGIRHLQIFDPELFDKQLDPDTLRLNEEKQVQDIARGLRARDPAAVAAAVRNEPDKEAAIKAYREERPDLFDALPHARPEDVRVLLRDLTHAEYLRLKEAHPDWFGLRRHYLAFEHRMYLALASVAVLAVAGGYALWDTLLPRPAGQGGQSPFSPGMTRGRVGLWTAKNGTVPDRATAVRWEVPVIVWAAASLALACATAARNSDYQSLLAIWQDTADKRPDSFLAHDSLGTALAAAGRTAEAIEQYEQALRLKPDDAIAHHNLALALAAADRRGEAIEHYRQPLRLKPDFAEAHYNWACTLESMGRTKEAVEHYHEALQRTPDSIVTLNNLAWLLATNEPAQGGDPARAVRLAQRARELSGEDNAFCLDTLAAAYAAAGRFPDAVATAQQAVQLAEAAGHARLAGVIRARLELYRAGRPYRAAPHLPPRDSR